MRTAFICHAVMIQNNILTKYPWNMYALCHWGFWSVFCWYSQLSKSWYKICERITTILITFK